MGDQENLTLRQNAFRAPIGTHCGQVFADAVGLKSRMQYTVLGDTVNVAARLQEADKTTVIDLVVSKDLPDRAGVPPAVTGSWSALEDTSIRSGQVRLPALSISARLLSSA